MAGAGRLLIAPRNREALHRLALLAEGHHRRDGEPRVAEQPG